MNQVVSRINEKTTNIHTYKIDTRVEIYTHMYIQTQHQSQQNVIKINYSLITIKITLSNIQLYLHTKNIKYILVQRYTYKH